MRLYSFTNSYLSSLQKGLQTAHVVAELFWQLVHHLIAHPLIGFSFGRLWAWNFHDWTLPKAWPSETREQPRRWTGLE